MEALLLITHFICQNRTIHPYFRPGLGLFEQSLGKQVRPSRPPQVTSHWTDTQKFPKLSLWHFLVLNHLPNIFSFFICVKYLQLWQLPQAKNPPTKLVLSMVLDQRGRALGRLYFLLWGISEHLRHRKGVTVERGVGTAHSCHGVPTRLGGSHLPATGSSCGWQRRNEADGRRGKKNPEELQGRVHVEVNRKCESHGRSRRMPPRDHRQIILPQMM